jgi:hypothetical protein
MTFDWLSWSSPVAVWWGFLLVVSAANIATFVLLQHRLRAQITARSGIAHARLLWLLCAAYVFGCAFRAVLPRADVQRICLFDTWLSSVLVGRSVATVAEVCFVIQWAIVLRALSESTKSDALRKVAFAIVPLIVLAECCSWYAVISTSYLGSAVENSLWAVTFLLIAGVLLRLLHEFRGAVRFAIGSAVVGIAAYIAFLMIIDVPMYFTRWQADVAGGKELLGLLAGLRDISTRWSVTHEIAHWRDEIPWMSLYFSVAVWSSIALCGFDPIKENLSRFRRTPRRQAAFIPLTPGRAYLRDESSPR